MERPLSACCGCLNNFSENNAKDVLDENAWIRLHAITENETHTENKEKRLKLHQAIELITGCQVTQVNSQSVRLCDTCLQKVQSYINFRARLLVSLGAQCNISYANDLHTSDQYARTTHHEKSNNKSTEISGSIDSKLPDTRPLMEEVINVDENSQPLNFSQNSLSDDDGDTKYSVSSITRLLNDEDNNNNSHLNDLETSNDYSAPSASGEIPPKVQQTDIESDIDVCSGEDDEVLELDGQCKRNEIVEIESSSESDIEVCDYEPAGKRIKVLF